MINTYLSPFRAWSDLWTRTSNARSSGGYFQSAKYRSVPRRRVWQIYYDTLSFILQKGMTYTITAEGSSTSADEISAENVRALENPRLLQSIEIRKVEGTYEEILLREVPFPKANEVNVEVEKWADQVMDNWRTVMSPSWLHEDIGRGGKESATRRTLAMLYRAASRTFHSTRVLRHLFTLHTALAEFDLAAKALDTYVELASKGKARVEKSGQSESGLDEEAVVLRTASAGIQMLCVYGRRKEIERAQEIAAILERWLEQKRSSSDPIASADDNRVDLREKQSHSSSSVPREVLAIAHRSLGLCYAHWARLTYETSSRPDLQDKAISNFRMALKHVPPGVDCADIQYALALVLAESRDVDEALCFAKQAISYCTQEDGETIPLSDGTSLQQSRNRRVLSKAWHLLAFLLSARQDFTTAMTSCEAACELYSDLLESGDHRKKLEVLALAERNGIMELKMSQITLSGILNGPEEAVNASSELLTLYKQLFVDGKSPGTQAPIIEVSSPDGTAFPPRTSNGTIKSSRRSLLGRSKEAVGTFPRIGHHSSRVPVTEENSQGISKDAEPSLIFDGSTVDRKYQPPHHLARQESKKLHKRHSRKSMASDHRNRRSSPNKSSLADGSEDSAQAKSPYVASLKRSSLEASQREPNVGEFISDGPSDRKTAENRIGDPSKSQRTTSKTMVQKNQDLAPESEKPPLSEPLKTSPASTYQIFSLPDPIYSEKDFNRHALTLLVRVWLLIAQLYCDAGMLVDAQGAVREARRQVQLIEAAVVAIESSEQALSLPDWRDVKSVAEIWADVLAEEAGLHIQLGNKNAASEAYEKALDWFPDHNAATVGLSNILLDCYDQHDPMNKLSTTPNSSSTSKPILASLPKDKVPENSMDQPGDSKIDESPALLSRLAARDRAYGLLSMLTKSGRGWDDSEAWSALARVHEQSGQIDKAKEALWWVVELEDTRPLRDWSCIGGF